MWYDAGEGITLGIDYKVEEQFVIPDSATVYIRDLTGAVVFSAALPAITTSETIVIPAAQNALTGSNLMENRFVKVTFLHQGATHQMHSSYQLKAFTPITATPAEVRAELGLDPSELPDTDIDVFSAYFRLISAAGEQFSLAFLTGSTRALAANQAVVVQAALDLTGSLDLRTAISSRAEDHQFARQATLDFEAIGRRLRSKLSQLIATATGTNLVTPSIFALSSPTDVVTGA